MKKYIYDLLFGLLGGCAFFLIGQTCLEIVYFSDPNIFLWIHLSLLLAGILEIIVLLLKVSRWYNLLIRLGVVHLIWFILFCCLNPTVHSWVQSIFPAISFENEQTGYFGGLLFLFLVFINLLLAFLCICAFFLGKLLQILQKKRQER